MDEIQQSKQTNHHCLDFLGIPESCKLGKRIYKKLFLENAQLGTTDKKAMRDDVDTITWVFKLSSETISIPGYEDDEREYNEIAVLQIDTKSQKRTRRIAEIINRAIPYPLVLVFRHLSDSDSEFCLFSLAHKRFSKSEKGAIVAEEFVFSDWIDQSCPTDVQASFIESLKVKQLPQSNLHELYTAMVDRLVALGCARFSGTYRVTSISHDQTSRRKSLAECHGLENEIAELKAALKKEPQFNRQVELNVKIKALEQQLKKKALAI